VYVGFGAEARKTDQDHLEYLGIDGRITLNKFSRSGLERYGLDKSTQDWDRWRALVNAVMNLRVP
jgi:hypothetical protein